MKETIIHWNRLENNNVPIGYGWYVAILKPRNHDEFDNINEYKDWIEQCGFNLIWCNNGKFWEDHINITDRVLFYAKRPNGFTN